MFRYLNIILCLCFAASASAQDIDVDPLDLPILPPNHAARKVAAQNPIAPPQPPTPPPPLNPEPPEVPPVFFGEEIAMNGTGSLIYVLDFSQSMSNFYERVNYNTTINRWEKVVIEARRSIKALAPTIQFDIVVFGTNGGCGVTMWLAEPVFATQFRKDSALAWLNKFHDVAVNGGATPTGPAVVAALALNPEVIVLLTDGSPSACGLPGYPFESHRRLIANSNMWGTRIDVFGIGLPDQYAEWFCRDVASDSSGMLVRFP